MAKEITGPQAQLNLSVVALVALVAIVGLVALVLNAGGSSVASYAEPTIERAAVVDDDGNIVGEAALSCKTLKHIKDNTDASDAVRAWAGSSMSGCQ